MALLDGMNERAFGELLREYRIAAGLSQEDLAERARMSAGAISALERQARRGPQHQTLSLIVEALDLAGDDRARLEKAADTARRRAVRGAPAGADVAPPHDPAPSNLPVLLTSLHGREADLTRMDGLLADRRLVTLLGAGGVGKTRLAIEAARRRAFDTRFSDGVWFVDAAPLATGELIVVAIARLLGIREQNDVPMLETLTAGMKTKNLLLVLDNCEHVVDESAQIVETLLGAVPGLSILTTTREALRIDGECVVRVEPLALDFETQSGPALDLFLERLSDANFSEFSHVPAEQIALAAEICKRLDGLPLALELAAGRARDLSLAQIVAGLEERFALLSSGRRTATPRQSTLHGAIAWSYEPLDASERAFFARLGLFAGSFSSQSAVDVCGEDVPGAREKLVTLIAKSLVSVGEDREGSLRYRLLESVRAFALDRLREDPDEDRYAARFARYFLERARAADHRYGRMPNAGFLALVEPDLDDFRAALEWSLGAERDVELGANLAGAMGWIYRQTSLFTEGTRWAERALTFSERLEPATIGRLHLARSYFYFNMAGSSGGMKNALDAAVAAVAAFRRTTGTADLAWALTAQAYSAYRFGDLDAVRAASEEAVRLAREAGDAYRLAGALNAYALTIPPERYAERFAVLEESIAASRASGDAGAIVPLAHLSAAYFEAGAYEKAFDCGVDVVAVARGLRDRSTLAGALINQSGYALAVERNDVAAASAREGLRLIGDLGKTLVAMCAVQHLGVVACRQGRFERGARLLGVSDQLYRESAVEREILEKNLYDSAIAEIRARIGEGALENHLRAGESLSIEAAIAEALA